VPREDDAVGGSTDRPTTQAGGGLVTFFIERMRNSKHLSLRPPWRPSAGTSTSSSPCRRPGCLPAVHPVYTLKRYLNPPSRLSW